MAVRKVIQAGNPILREKSKIVSDIGSEKVQKIIQDLIDSMRKSQVVGIAAPQIGKGLRIFASEIRVSSLKMAPARAACSWKSMSGRPEAFAMAS